MIPTNPCCAPFAKAFTDGTDNEGHNQLFDASRYEETPGAVYVGYDLPPIGFCPWCGKPASGRVYAEPT